MLNLLIEATAALILIVPAFLLLNSLCFRSPVRTRRYLIFGLYLAAVYHIVGLPTVHFLTFDATVNLIPFLPMKEDLRNTVLNVILFVPLGCFLPYQWIRYRRMGETMLIGFCATLAIELCQLLTYRVTDINDIIANFTGCLAGYLLFRILFLLSGGKLRTAGKNRDFPMILCTVIAVMFFLQPLVASLFYKLT